jgi:hypothetical protein
MPYVNSIKKSLKLLEGCADNFHEKKQGKIHVAD